MCSWLQPYFSCCCEITASFVIQQLQSSSCVTYPHIMSALQLIQKVINFLFSEPLIFILWRNISCRSSVFHWLLRCSRSSVTFFSTLYRSVFCMTGSRTHNQQTFFIWNYGTYNFDTAITFTSDPPPFPPSQRLWVTSEGLISKSLWIGTTNPTWSCTQHYTTRFMY